MQLLQLGLPKALLRLAPSTGCSLSSLSLLLVRIFSFIVVIPYADSKSQAISYISTVLRTAKADSQALAHELLPLLETLSPHGRTRRITPLRRLNFEMSTISRCRHPLLRRQIVHWSYEKRVNKLERHYSSPSCILRLFMISGRGDRGRWRIL